ncbi:hypothetical protein CONPUDRAFT_126852 [Coniophora puteana RWD-64-598 SS2]|uniref:Uncharacterized protein n=1 Tax=Coniophora puteana (strain RWD-64-598) TaxID=741705 RepID=A0A5M3MJS7_CONPW|nr:uncharacterized protein CONPUDRAFT_126852 [Coniophora puteana RWD-64-598 SS2]EIW79054.1 hypothetical protein CONPUDRAFT_126852 [Coniophora puteana RWD-64-598 SS2]
MSSGSVNGSASVPPETSEQLLADAIKLVGSTTVCGTFYGIMTVLAGACVHTLLARRSRAMHCRRWLAILVGYVVLLWLCGTLYIACLSRTMQDAYVYRRLEVQAPSEWADFTMPENIIGDAANVLAICLADGLMIWRMRTIWFDSAWYSWLMPIPMLAYIGLCVSCGLTVIMSSLPGHDFYAKITFKTTIPVFVLSLVINVYTTSFMALRLYTFRRWFTKHMGTCIAHPKQYTDMATIFVESCALLTVTFSIATGFYLAQHPARYLCIAVLSQVQIISPLLVIYRISRGIAWRADTTTTSHNQDQSDAAELGDCQDGGGNCCAVAPCPSLKFARVDDDVENSDENNGQGSNESKEDV